MACSSSLLLFKLENADTRNPLECLICDREFSAPVRLPCQHSFCGECVQGRSACPVCGVNIEGELLRDSLLAFLIETSHETADICANCDKISQPMHFCETCQQPLCNECRQNTHQAKMFASHRVVPLEERARVKGRVTCPLHGEPFILYSVENRSLACIVCFNNAALDTRHHLVHIDAAHKLGCEKLEKATVKLRTFQDDVREQLQLRKRLASELAESYRNACANIRLTCQEMMDTMMSVRDRMLRRLEEDRATREQHFKQQMRHLIALQPSIRLYLLSASIFCSSASKLDFLQSSTDLMKRIQALVSMECDKPQFTGELSVNAREEFSGALEPFLGLSSILLSTGRNHRGDSMEPVCGTTSPRNHHSYVRRSGSGYVNGCSSLSTKYQLVVDLAGAFGEQFARVEGPLRQYGHEMASLGKKVQETQRDLTLRRCMIDKNAVDELVKKCVDLDVRVGQQSALINDLQPQLQQIWQEQLDRVRRQQGLFREKIDETIALREGARHVANAARQLEPFAVCLAAVTTVIDRRRCHPPDPAPMESICLQINTIEPDSEHRIQAIEKEEQNRRLAQDQKKREEQLKFAAAKKQLKTTKELKKFRESTRDGAPARPRIVNTARDRSPGGTDQALLSPCNRRHKGCSSIGSRSQSDMDDVESSMDDSFEFTAESSTAEAETVKIESEHRLCRSQPLRLSTPIPMGSARRETTAPVSTSLPNDEQLEKRAAALNRANVANDDTVVSGCIGGAAPTANVSSPSSSTSGSTGIPRAPFVPITIFSAANSPSPGAWEVREKLLESLKQKVPRVEVGATKTPERELRPDTAAPVAPLPPPPPPPPAL